MWVGCKEISISQNRKKRARQLHRVGPEVACLRDDPVEVPRLLGVFLAVGVADDGSPALVNSANHDKVPACREIPGTHDRDDGMTGSDTSLDHALVGGKLLGVQSQAPAHPLS